MHVYSLPFLYPVKLEEAPDYLNVISHPMDLDTIRSNIENLHYRYEMAQFISPILFPTVISYSSNSDEFLSDITVMYDNCRSYCTSRFPHIVPQAEVVHEITVTFLSSQCFSLLMQGSFSAGEAPLSTLSCISSCGILLVSFVSVFKRKSSLSIKLHPTNNPWLIGRSFCVNNRVYLNKP
jgi:hypothetical protein